MENQPNDLTPKGESQPLISEEPSDQVNNEPIESEQSPSQNKEESKEYYKRQPIPSQVVTEQQSDPLLAKIHQLENKLKYYESEHSTFQNQLLLQRQSHEQSLLKLGSQDYEAKMAEEYASQLLQKVDIQICKEKLDQLTEINAQLIEKTQKLEQENEILQSDYTQLKEVQDKQTKERLQDQSESQKLIEQKQIVQKEQIEVEMSIQTESIVNIQLNESQFLKLQKKMSELELYLQEKDKVILEQETSLSELQDQLHDLMKSEAKLQTQGREKQQKIEDLGKELKFMTESCELKVQDMQHQVNAKEGSLSDALSLVSEKEIEIQRYLRQSQEAEDAVKEYRVRNMTLEDEQLQYEQKFQEYQEESEQLKADFEAVLQFKNELETLIEEQTQHLEAKKIRMNMVEEALRFKESDLEKKESLLRRMTQGADETKKKLSQTEMKLRQLTQTTMRDMKVKVKEKMNEIEVLKEMVKSANMQAKAKDIDIQRLNKRIQRLEKMTELNKGMIQESHSQLPVDTSNAIMEDDNDLADTDTFTTPLRQHQVQVGYPNKRNHDQLGLNPANYTNPTVEDEVQMELLAAQNQRHFNLKNQGNHRSNQNYRNSRQKEIEEAVELDRMLEIERKNQQHDVFQKKYDEKLDKYQNNLNAGHLTNIKNNSSSIRGIFGGAEETNRMTNDSIQYYEGMLPTLNMSKKEKLEQELMNEINESMQRKDKYMTPNLQGKSKIINKINAVAYGGSTQSNKNGHYQNERNSNSSKHRMQL